MKELISAILILTLILSPVYAGDWQDGLDAYTQGDYKTAFEKWKPLAEQGSYDAQIAVGDIRNEQDRYQEAIAEYNKAVNINPNLAGAHTSLGDVYRILDRNQEAIAEYKEAIRLEPNLIGAYLGLERLYVELGLFKEAIPIYWKIISLEPESSYPHLRLGVAYRRLARSNDAIAEFREALLISPDYSLPQYNLGQMYAGGEGVLKDYIKAHKWLNIAGANGHKKAGKVRDTIEKLMTSEQIAEAQQLAKEWMERHKKK